MLPDFWRFLLIEIVAGHVKFCDLIRRKLIIWALVRISHFIVSILVLGGGLGVAH